MLKLTDEQRDAVNVHGKNAIVSAGAGAGKTKVLTTRVQKEVKEGTKVDRLIILTFTNNAAQEMKDRIRKVVQETPEISDQLDLVDSAYITTFDSFAQSLVKKYNYLLNIDKHFTIIDENIVNVELKNILTDIFDKYYENPTDEFNNFIHDFCYKEDDSLIASIIKMYRSLTNMKDRNSFLETYISTYYTNDRINNYIKEFRNYLLDKSLDLIPYYNIYLKHVIDTDAEIKLEERINKVNSASTVDELVEILNERKPQNSKNKKVYDDDDFAIIKKITSDTEKYIKDNAALTDEELANQYLYTKDNVIFLINILKELDRRILEFKTDHNAYEFQDISLLAIKLVKEHPDVAKSIRESTDEIMIDEYQDTNDIQEEFISYISNNNVYMVGDVKQSIYRFRHANPYIFKDKYDKYTKYNQDKIDENAIGYRVDMTKNFRSRTEVISNINDLFSDIMFNEIGGANYRKDHKMEALNGKYDIHKMDDYNYNMEIYNYDPTTITGYNKNEIEAFIIAKDIKEKMDSKMNVMDKDNNDLFNPIEYKDFCILVDKSTNFDLLKKVLEYHKIPATIYKDISIKEDDEVYILKNLITLLIHIKEDNLNNKFNHAYMSIARSYIFKMDDEKIFDIFHNKTFKETELYKSLQSIANCIDGLSNKEILIKLINEFDMFNKLITVSDIRVRSAKLEYFINNADALNKFGLDIYSLEKYFDDILNSDDDIQMAGKIADNNAVKIMTIHGSKGLEFPIVYMPYLGTAFKSNKETRYPISNKYGILIDYKKDNILDKTFVKTIYDYDELKENISEKIRLFYVAVTRAREKFILINTWNDRIDSIGSLTPLDLIHSKCYRDLLSMMKTTLSKYTKNIDLTSIGLTSDYNKNQAVDYNQLIIKTNEVITTNELNIEYKIAENKHFSKPLSKIIDREFKEVLDKGTMLHECFEAYNFNNSNLDDLNIKEEYKDNIRKFLSHTEVKDISKAKTYKEHEIRYKKDGYICNGIIDLLVEYEDHFDIIDYKTNNVESEEYVEQLNGYKDYIQSKYGKPTYTYLYSIEQNSFKKL